MASSEEIKLAELPEAVIEAAMRHIANYSIGFLHVNNPTHSSGDVMLLGSGTLVSIGNVHAILTADHVLSVLPKSGRLGLILSATTQQYTIDTQGITYVHIERGTHYSDGPDLGAVVLSNSIASSIAAKKVFYNLSVQRDHILSSPPDIHDGFWFINGFVDEKTTEEKDKDGYDLVKGFFNLSGAGGPEDATVVGNHDYYVFPVSYSVRSVSPKSYGGMSGGGLWQVPLTRNVQGEIEHTKPIYSGVVFYQQPATETYCGVKCHGRQSVYNVAYNAIK
ncbi:MAG: hypothetical protein K4571_08870 [Deltaproteobacteria bacterium]